MKIIIKNWRTGKSFIIWQYEDLNGVPFNIINFNLEIISL